MRDDVITEVLIQKLSVDKLEKKSLKAYLLKSFMRSDMSAKSHLLMQEIDPRV